SSGLDPLPTRRSSDLEAACQHIASQVVGAKGVIQGWRHAGFQDVDLLGIDAVDVGTNQDAQYDQSDEDQTEHSQAIAAKLHPGRSEEHTPELQSRENH